MLTLWNALNECGRSIMIALARYLETDEQDSPPMGEIRFFAVFAIRRMKSSTDRRVRWAAAHEDINLITLLPSSKERGLELLRKDGTWMAIEPVPRTTDRGHGGYV